MRIDPTQVVTATPQLETGRNPSPARRDPSNTETVNPPQLPVPAQSAAPAMLPEPSQLNVSLDDRRNIIYRFTDPNNGQVVRQVPPEEMLRIMRNIKELLQESEQKLKVTS